LITLEEPLNGDLNDPSITVPVFLGDSVIHMKNIGYGEAFNRTLRIIKHRGSWHAEGIFPYRILKGLGIVIEGSAYVTEMRSAVKIDDILAELGVKKDEIPQSLLKKLKKLTEDEVPYSREDIAKIIKRVIECY